MRLNFTIEDLPASPHEGRTDVVDVELPPCTPEEQEIVNPLVPPTSGLRIKLLERVADGKWVGKASIHALFLRVFQAICEVCGGREGEPMEVLLVSDERPTSQHLLEEAARIILASGHRLYFQEGGGARSHLSTPYASAALALFNQLDLVVVVTASHNSVDWNGIKFYYKLPIPISGDLMREVSRKALSYEKVTMLARLPADVPTLPVEERNNDYVVNLLDSIIDLRATRGQKVVLWPFWGRAAGITSLLTRLGVDLEVIQENVNPPDPTVMTDVHRNKVVQKMKETGAKLAVLLDADRDRIVFLIARDGDHYTLSPNELYTAMHNILARDFARKVVNVRTIPSDPRGDGTSVANYVTGVGYKHLGVVLYLLTKQLEDESQFTTGILYYKKGEQFFKIDRKEAVFEPVNAAIESGRIQTGDTLVFVLWEESGGHTFNLLSLDGTDPPRLSSKFPIVGDKTPAAAICVLAELVYRGYDLDEWVDRSIVSHREEIHAQDREKLAIMEKFKGLVGSKFEAGGRAYEVFAFSDNGGELETVGLRSESSVLYFRPSGTGPAIRIYIFGDASTYAEEIAAVKREIEEKFK